MELFKRVECFVIKNSPDCFLPLLLDYQVCVLYYQQGENAV